MHWPRQLRCCLSRTPQGRVEEVYRQEGDAKRSEAKRERRSDAGGEPSQKPRPPAHRRIQAELLYS